MGSEENRFPLPHQERWKRWGGCLAALSCFGSQKGGKRVVPASRIPDSNASVAQPNGPQGVGLNNQVTALAPSLLAPPSSPTSFTNSAFPSTAQSPNCFLSANSPGGPSSSMFATGPYAHETQLVSPPVFSTFTTEPSTAPLTPPPELAHLTTPSSPDVPFARFLTSSMDLKNTEKANYAAPNDLRSTSSFYPESPASSLRLPISRVSSECLSSPSFPEQEFPARRDPLDSSQNGKYSRSGSGRHMSSSSKISQDSNFFCPATFAQFYLDHNPPFPHTGGRLSVSKDSDAYPASGNGHQNRYNRSPKQDAEELEAYRASFGFSADEIISTPQYVEISDVTDDTFTMTPFASNKSITEKSEQAATEGEDQRGLMMQANNPSQNCLEHTDVGRSGKVAVSCNIYEDRRSRGQTGNASGSSTPEDRHVSDDDGISSKAAATKIIRKYQLGLSSSDAELEYRRGRSLREGRGDFAWRGS